MPIIPKVKILRGKKIRFNKGFRKKFATPMVKPARRKIFIGP